MPKTAAIIIIGDEILSGKVHDSNSHFLAAGLRELGIVVDRIAVIPDRVEVIASEVASASWRYDYVFTSGGIGPTHDDVTIEGVAKAFGLKTVTNEDLMGYLERRCQGRLTKAVRKMAELPEGAELVGTEGRFPAVVVKNVFIFPGVPELLREKFEKLRERFEAEPFYLKRVFVDEEECYIAEHLETVIEEFPDVMVGSYPRFGDREFRVVLTVESRDPDELDTAFKRLMELLPEEVVKGTE